MTEIHPGDPVRSVELRESAWNTILEATQYIQLGYVSNVVTVIKEQLREPIALSSSDKPRGVYVVTAGMEGEEIIYPHGDDWVTENGELTVSDLDHHTVAAFAAGTWGRVFVTPPKKETDDEPATS